MRIIGGLLVAGVGIALIMYAGSLAKMLGRREWAEKHLGGTMQGYIVIGFVIIVVGVMMMFGSQFVKPDPTGFTIK